MVNVDFTPSLVLGLGMIGGGLALYQVRLSRPWISRDYDVVISSISILTGGILVFQVRLCVCSQPSRAEHHFAMNTAVFSPCPSPPQSKTTPALAGVAVRSVAAVWAAPHGRHGGRLRVRKSAPTRHHRRGTGTGSTGSQCLLCDVRQAADGIASCAVSQVLYQQLVWSSLMTQHQVVTSSLYVLVDSHGRLVLSAALG